MANSLKKLRKGFYNGKGQNRRPPVGQEQIKKGGYKNGK